MRPFLALALAAFLPSMLSAETPEPADAAPILAMGAYVATDDMAVTEAFYRALFARDPLIRLPDFKAFEVAGGWFAIVSRDRYAPGATAGSGAVPYLQAAELETLQTRAAAAGAASSGIIDEPGIQLLKVTDPNGQLIEFFRLTGQ